jgi:delta-aminolevulinic acid dehydratase/porphobilinogen synthase
MIKIAAQATRLMKTKWCWKASAPSNAGADLIFSYFALDLHRTRHPLKL